MSVFRSAPIGAVSRAFGITAVNRNPAYHRNASAAEPPSRRSGAANPPSPPCAGTAAGPAPGADYPLAGLLHCAACGLRLRPMEMLGGRAYGAPCGCRLTVVAADTVERLVFDAVVAREPTADDCGGADDEPRPGRAGPGVSLETRRCWAALFRRHLAEVRIGGTLDDLTLIWIV